MSTLSSNSFLEGIPQAMQNKEIKRISEIIVIVTRNDADADQEFRRYYNCAIRHRLLCSWM